MIWKGQSVTKKIGLSMPDTILELVHQGQSIVNKLKECS